MAKQRVRTMILSLAVYATVGGAAASPLDGTIWQDVAVQTGTDATLLYAISLVESRRGNATGVSPWPWALNGESGAHYPKTREEAAAILHRELSAARSSMWG